MEGSRLYLYIGWSRLYLYMGWVVAALFIYRMAYRLYLYMGVVAYKWRAIEVFCIEYVQNVEVYGKFLLENFRILDVWGNFVRGYKLLELETEKE